MNRPVGGNSPQERGNFPCRGRTSDRPGGRDDWPFCDQAPEQRGLFGEGRDGGHRAHRRRATGSVGGARASTNRPLKESTKEEALPRTILV